MNDAQLFLLDKKCGDLILNNRPNMNPGERIYVSDIMNEFAAFQKESTPSEEKIKEDAEREYPMTDFALRRPRNSRW